MSDPYRELAEEVVREIPHEGSLDDGEGGEVVARWEARLRSTLPELSQALGELAVARGAVNLALLRTMTVWSEDRESEDGFDGSDVEQALSSALSSDLGRLAGELIRAAVEEELAVERASRAWDRSERDQVSMKHVADYEKALSDRWKLSAVRAGKTAALLAACPGLRKEVER